MRRLKFETAVWASSNKKTSLFLVPQVKISKTSNAELKAAHSAALHGARKLAQKTGPVLTSIPIS